MRYNLRSWTGKPSAKRGTSIIFMSCVRSWKWFPSSDFIFSSIQALNFPHYEESKGFHKHTFTQIVVLTSQTVKTYAPYWLTLAVVATLVIVENVLVNLILDLEELILLEFRHTILTNIKIWYLSALISFQLSLHNVAVTFIATYLVCPFIVCLSQLIPHTFLKM